MRNSSLVEKAKLLARSSTLWILLHFVHLGQPDGVRPNRSILVVTLVYKLDTLLASFE